MLCHAPCATHCNYHAPSISTQTKSFCRVGCMRVGFVNVLAACSVPCGDGFLFFVLKVADTLGNVLREAVRAEHLYDNVRSNMQTLHMAISHVEDVVGPHGLLAGEAPGSGEERVSGAAMLTGKTSNAPQIADVMQRRAMDATRMARLRAAMMLNPERRRRVVEGARAQASLNDDRPGSESARPAGDGFAADELLLWSHAPEPSQASDARASRGLASVEASLSRLSAKFSRQAQRHAA